jgi:DNA polymerase
MESYPAMPKHEWNLWRLDQMINLRGMPVDAAYVANASAIMQEADAITLMDLKGLTGLSNPNSGMQMKSWLAEQGYEMDSLATECIDAALLCDLPPVVRSALSLRQKLSGAGPKKLTAIMSQVSPDGRLRNQFGFYVGHTGRWAGRGVQVQNLPRPDFAVADRLEEVTDAVRLGTLPEDLDVSTAITSTIRSSFRASAGHHLVIVDYASIESRVLAWLANCQSMQAVYREGRCAYKDFAVKINVVSYDEVTKQQRTQAKPAVLGCGYGMGAARLAEYAKSMNIPMTEKEALLHVKAFREAYPEIPTLWGTVEWNAFRAVRDKKKFAMGNGLVFDARDARFLRICLPSGRDLFYLKPKIIVRTTVYGETQSMSFEAAGKAGLQVNYTYGAKLVENIVQALSRDILCHGLLSAHRANFNIIGHVHDEIICEELIGSDRGDDALSALLSVAPVWGPDMVLAAEGESSTFYKK